MHLKNLLKKLGFKINLKFIIYFSRIHSKILQYSNGRIMHRLIGLDMLLLLSIGIKTGKERTTPLLYIEDKGRYFCVASYAGNQSHPNWYYNIVKEPKVTLRIRKGLLKAEASSQCQEIAEYSSGFVFFAEHELRIIFDLLN